MLLYNEIFALLQGEDRLYFQNQYRLNPSALLLKNGLPAAGAAFARGFNCLPCFYKRFREYCHMTPQDFQKNGK